MDNNTAYEYLSGLTADLNEKIRGLDLAVSSVDQSVTEKAMLIRNKAVGILNNVKEKTVDLSEAIADNDELFSAIKTIEEKADSLYSEAIQKINDLQEEAVINKAQKAEEAMTMQDNEELVDMTDIADREGVSAVENDETKDDIEELIDDRKEEFQHFERQQTAPKEEHAATERSEVTIKALEVLNDWLRPDEVRK